MSEILKWGSLVGGFGATAFSESLSIQLFGLIVVIVLWGGDLLMSINKNGKTKE